MKNNSIKLIGKEFNPSTIEARRYLEALNIDYTYSDIDFDLESKMWLHFQKIISIPVLIIGNHWIVGYTAHDYEAFFQYLNEEN